MFVFCQQSLVFAEPKSSDGYRDAKWGMGKSEVEGVLNDGRFVESVEVLHLPSGTIEPNAENVKIFDGEEVEIDDGSKLSASYAFYKDKFFCATKPLTISGSSWAPYLQAMKKKYGQSVQVKTRSWKEYRGEDAFQTVNVTYAVWGDKGVSLSKETFMDNLIIEAQYYSTIILNEMRKDALKIKNEIDIKKSSEQKKQLKKTLDEL